MARNSDEGKPARKRPGAKAAGSRSKPASRAAKPAATSRARKPAARKPAARKPAARKPAARKPAARKPSPRRAPGRRPPEEAVLRRAPGADDEIELLPAPVEESLAAAVEAAPEERLVDMSAFTAGSESHVEAHPKTFVAGKEPRRRRVRASAGFLLDAARRRKGGRLALWGVVVLLAFGGIGLLTYPFFTHWWADRIQGRLEKQFTQPGTILAYRSHKIPIGGAVTRIKIPKLGVNVIVVEGISGNALRAGAGHYPGTALPGEVGNVAIAGHRTGFGQPFRHLERLRPGDDIILETPLGTFTYEVVEPFDGHGSPWITGPSDWTVIEPTPYAALTLTTCDPPHTSKNRLIVRARLVPQGFAG